MGCCVSRPDGPNAPYPDANDSSRAINVPSSASAARRASHHPPEVEEEDRRLGSQADGPDVVSSSSPAASSPATIGHRSQQDAAAVPVPSNVPQLQPPQPLQSSLAVHINQPMVRRRWTAHSRQWTRRTIDQERIDFFDTRVTCRPEVWQALHSALKLLWAADLVEAERRATRPTTAAEAAELEYISPELEEAEATAQTILDAAGITLPMGDISLGAYDAQGNLYKLPRYIVRDPKNLASEPEPDPDDVETKEGALDGEGEAALSSASEGEDEAGDDADDDAADETAADETVADGDDDGTADDDLTQAQRQQRTNRIRSRREKKGKAVLPADAQVSVRVRLSTVDKDVVVQIGRNDTVHSLVHRVTEAARLPVKTRISIAYLGKPLKEGQSLAAQGWKEGHVVNAFVLGAP